MHCRQYIFMNATILHVFEIKPKHPAQLSLGVYHVFAGQSFLCILICGYVQYCKLYAVHGAP